MKKAFRYELLELCKSRIKKPSTDVFFFNVTLTVHDMFTEAGTATIYMQKFKAPRLPTKVQKMNDLRKRWVSTGKQLEDFRRKKEQKLKLRLLKNT